jgi:hypothetical protein
MKDLPHRGLLLAAITFVTVCALSIPGAAVVVVGSHRSAAAASRAAPSGTPRATSSAAGAAAAAPPTGTGRWWSGASGHDAASGRYGAWRGEPVAIGGAWVNGDDEQQRMFEICDPTADWVRWKGPLDLAVGAIDVTRGESWAAAARGAYDARWRKHLQRTEQCWGTRDPKLLYLRFAHEMNTARVPWRVRGGEEAAFVRAITRYSTLRYAIMPGVNVVICPSDRTDAGLGTLDVRRLWPGRDARGRPVANVYAVDAYDQRPHVTTAKDARARIDATSAGGSLLGLESHRRFAESKGVPFAVGEWGNNGDAGAAGGGGESPEYVRAFHAWASRHAGDPAHPRPGQLLYEVQFNLLDAFTLWPRTVQPRTAAAYRELTWGVAGVR